MAAAISAGDLALAMSRANNSARLSGADMNNFIGYVTTVADVSLKSAESVGESFKTIFSRFGNVKAGKFTATEADMSMEGYTEDSFENLNDIETVLSKVGVRLRENASTWRDIDDVLSEIGEKWAGWDQTTKNAAATAIAGTRQRENVITLFENWDQVAKFAQIAENSYGTAAEKMKSYSNSVEAAQKRITVAVEKLGESINGSDALKLFYNTISDLVENLGTLGLVVMPLIGALNVPGLLKSGASLITSIGLRLQAPYGKTATDMNSIRGGVGLGQALKEGNLAAYERRYSAALEARTLGLTEELIVAAKSLLKQIFAMETEEMLATSKAMELYLNGAKIDEIIKELGAGDIEIGSKMALKIANDLLTEQEIEEAKAAGVTEDAEVMLQKALYQRAKATSKAGFAAVGTGAGVAANGVSPIVSGATSLLGSIGLGAALSSGKLGDKYGLTPMFMAGSIIGGIVPKIGEKVGEKLITKELLGISGGVWGMIAFTLFEVIVGGIKFFRQYQKKKATEEVQEAFNEISQKAQEAIQLNLKTSRYDELVAGVGNYGENVSLSSEDYQEFLDISNQLAETFSELDYYTDELGNKIVQLNGKTSKLTDTIEELTKSMQKEQARLLLKEENGGQIYNDLTKDYLKEVENRLDKISDINKIIEALENTSDDIFDVETYAYGFINSMDDEEREAFLTKYNIKFDKDNLDKFVNGVESVDWKLILNDYTDELNNYIKNSTPDLNDIIKALLSLITGYSESDKSMQNFVQQSVKSISLIDENGELKDYQAYLDEVQLIAQTTLMIALNNQEAFDIILDSSSTAEAVKNARTSLRDQIITLFGGKDDIMNLSEDGKKILIALGFEWDDNAKGYIDKEYDIVSKYAEKGYLKQLGLSENDLANYSYSDLLVAYEKLGKAMLPRELVQSKGGFSNFVSYAKYGDSSLQELISSYKLLQDSKKYLDETSDNQEIKEKIEEYKSELELLTPFLDKWIKILGLAEGDYDSLIMKAKILGNVTEDGVSTLTPEQFIEKRGNYQEIYDYIRESYASNGGFTGEIANMIAADPDLLPYLNNISGMSKYLNSWLGQSEDGYKDVLVKEMLSNQQFSQQLIDTNKELYLAMFELYEGDLTRFTTIQAAKELISDLLDKEFFADGEAWVAKMAEYYKIDLTKFTEEAAKKKAVGDALAKDLYGSSSGYDSLVYYYSEKLGYTQEDAENKALSDLNNRFIAEETEKLQKLMEPIAVLTDNLVSGLDVTLDTFDETAKAADRLKAKLSSLNKEWAEMQAFMGDTSALDKYYDEMEDILDKLYELKMAEYQKKGDTEEGLEALAEAKDYYVQKKNLDDQRAEDAISILENQGLLNDNVIAAYETLVATADTEAERIEYQKRLNDKIKEQKNLVKLLLGFQQDLLTTLREYEKYTPNSDYYANIITRSESNLRQQMQAAADRATNAYNLLYEASYKNWTENGYSKEIAARKAAYEASQDSDYQQAVKDYIDAYQSLATLALDVFNEKIDALQRKIDDLEKSKSQEWSSIDQIREYYTAMDELQKQIRDQAKETLNYIDDMTDEQVQEVVDKYNDAIKEINQNMIDQYSDIKEYQESIYSALGNEVGRYKEQLEEQKKVIEEQYDEELKKLQDKQTSISRVNKLLEIQNNIRNAGQEKERVYREGKMDALYKCGIKRLKARNGSDRAKFILQLVV